MGTHNGFRQGSGLEEREAQKDRVSQNAPDASDDVIRECDRLDQNRIDGDTLINGVTWKKVYNSIWGTDLKDSYYLAIREEGKKVYAIAKGSKRPRLLYDFNLEVGDDVRCGMEGNVFGCLLDKDEKPDTLLGFPFVFYLRVECIDTITVQGKEYRRFTLSLLDSFRERFFADSGVPLNPVIWFEGIGSAAGPFSPWMPQSEGLIVVSSSKEDYREVGQHADIGDKTLDKNYNSTPTCDLQGRVSKLLKGIYIRDGRKVVM